MAEPAHGGAEAARPEHPAAAQLDPRKLVWADVRSAIITNARAAALAVSGLGRRPGDAAALEMAELTREAFERAVEIGRQWVVSEAVLNEEHDAGFREGVEWCKAQRGRLEVIDGGAVPGPH
jgi:hypothetical protein